MSENITILDGQKYTMHKAIGGELVLTPIASEEPTEREPQCGDVFVGEFGDYSDGYCGGFTVYDGEGHCYGTAKFGTFIIDPIKSLNRRLLLNIFDFANGDYVKKQDVIDALSHKDKGGDDVMGRIKRWSNERAFGYDKTYAAFKDLGIL